MSDELYDFPLEYIGRKTFVHVDGHKRSVPKFKTYLGSDRRHKVLPEYGGDEIDMSSAAPYILPDKLAYVSPLDGTHISSRSSHREHMARHDVVEAGDLKPTIGRSYEASRMSRAGNDIVRAMQQLRNG